MYYLFLPQSTHCKKKLGIFEETMFELRYKVAKDIEEAELVI